MGSYNLAYVAAVLLFLINVAIAAIQAVYVAGHGADLGITPQFQAWLAIASAVIAAALGVLPRVNRTPAARETAYLKAAAGVLPDDLAAKHTVVVAPVKPFDTIE